MQMKRSARSATLFSRVSAAPPPLIMQPRASISSAPSTYTGTRSTSLASNTVMPCARSRSVLCCELDTAPRMRDLRPARASMKRFTVDPVPTPTIASSGTWIRAAWPTSVFSSSWVIADMDREPRQQGWENAGIMSLVPYALTRPFLFGLDAERAHDLTLGAIATLQNTPAQCLWSRPRVDDPVTVAGLRFPNRVGLAAGLDKNGECIDGLGAMGFGVIEVGTVTPKAQPGNPKPRLFRLPKAQALINRLGFNNEGLDTFLDNVRRSRSFREAGGILGLNIGKNAATPIERAVDDYLIGLTGVFPHADYVTVNISSPNTKNLRELQSDEALDALLSALQERRQKLAQQHGRQVPVFVKIAPDLDDEQAAV